MKSARPNQRGISTRFTAVLVAVMIVISSAAMAEVLVKTSPKNETGLILAEQTYQSRPCVVSSVLAQGENWTSFNSSAPGTPAQVHVTISDTSGITIVADFFGFWRDNYTVDPTTYDTVNIPGASTIRDPGQPMLPCLFEYVEIPHDINVSVDVIASSSADLSGYNITPAPFPNVPFELYDPLDLNASIPSALLPFFLDDSTYSSDDFFPGSTTSIEGGTVNSSLVMRGHRLLGLNFYPIQWNPATRLLRVHSQIVIKVSYSIPAQIQPIPQSLRSETFERILKNIVLNRDCGVQYTRLVGAGTALGREGAEYLIVTNAAFESQAQRLAEWKQRKGVPSAVWPVGGETEGQRREAVRYAIETAYNQWNPAPTYVLLLGDVESIPANYDEKHQARYEGFNLYYQSDGGNIASDLGYFTIDGWDYIPDIVYGRISVDTEDQARIVVDKILEYEQSPPDSQSFYKSALSVGHFYDRNRDRVEDSPFPFIYTLERVRLYLEGNAGYRVHINYSCADRDPEPTYFQQRLNLFEPTSNRVQYSIPVKYAWLNGTDMAVYWANSIGNITLNINQNRSLVFYYCHGESGNMVYPDGERGSHEGWVLPWFDTSCFSSLSNGNNTPLFLNVACNTGWYDGENDENWLEPWDRYRECSNECFAEEITRLEGGGAIAAIAPSRVSYGLINAHLLDGIVQAFWPGYLGSEGPPIYEMGAALLSGKLYSKTQWAGLDAICQLLGNLLGPSNVVRTTFEEYHLFGDPETQLWTDTPSHFDVTYPPSVGTSSPQQFAVTVRDTSGPVYSAKVCIQQGLDVYQVGYTNHKGQVTFDITPSGTLSSLSVTVTKHDYVPHLGAIQVVDRGAWMFLSPSEGSSYDGVVVSVSGFRRNAAVSVYSDEEPQAVITAGEQSVLVHFSDGPSGYVNVRAVQGDTVATTRFYRLSTTDNPDPYIYSQYDSDTWSLTGGERVWDNPCIAVYQGCCPVNRVCQGIEYSVRVTVFNRAGVVAADTNVALSYARLGGATSWIPIGTTRITIGPSGSGEVTFRWVPLLSRALCLKVELEHGDESPDDMTDNMGQECLGAILLSSPGVGIFQVANPTDSTDYVLVKVRQKGDYDDVWEASVEGYSCQAVPAGENETVTLLVDPGADIESDDSRQFTVEMYVNCTLAIATEFTAAQTLGRCTCYWPCLLLVGAILLVGVGALGYRKKRGELAVGDLCLFVCFFVLFSLFVFAECDGYMDLVPGLGEPTQGPVFYTPPTG